MKRCWEHTCLKLLTQVVPCRSTGQWAAHATAHAQSCAPDASQVSTRNSSACQHSYCSKQANKHPGSLIKPRPTAAHLLLWFEQASESNKIHLHSRSRCRASYMLRLLPLTTPCCKPAAQMSACDYSEHTAAWHTHNTNVSAFNPTLGIKIMI